MQFLKFLYMQLVLVAGDTRATKGQRSVERAACVISRVSRENPANRTMYYKILQPSIKSLLSASLSGLHLPAL